MAESKPKSRRGGARPGAGRKPKNHLAPSAIGALDQAAAYARPVPERVEDAAQRTARTALEALVKVLIGGSSESAKVAAANAVLDRGYGKPAVEAPGEAMLPFLGVAPAAQLGAELRQEARRHAELAIEVLHKIATAGQSESARVAAAKSLLDRGLGTSATAKVPAQSGVGAAAAAIRREQERAPGKKEEARASAREAARGRFATPPAPRTLQ